LGVRERVLFPFGYWLAMVALAILFELLTARPLTILST
jgi:hypothetical protein